MKIKTVKTYYGRIEEGYYYRIGELDRAVINADTLSGLYPEMLFVNISNDTFSSDVQYQMLIDFRFYDDTDSPLIKVRAPSPKTTIDSEFFPDDTLIRVINFSLLDMIDIFTEGENIDLAQIAYLRMIIGFVYTSQDGTYSERAFYEGADTSIFYIVRGNVGIQEIEQKTNVISVYPNPARSQFIVTNTENASLQLYNMAGQQVLYTYSKENNTVINMDFLPQGVYVLKALKDGVFSTHKIVINNQKY
jgi:hypothetical protein